MKYNININQKAIVDLGLKDKVDFIDLAIFDCICAFAQTNICTKIIIGEETFFLIKASLIKEQLPLLGISTDRGINKRIDKLIECGLIERCPQNKSLKHPYYKLGNLVCDVLFTTWNDCSKSTMNDCSKPYIYINNNTVDSKDNEDNNKDNKIEKDNISIVESDEEFAERMYRLYPTKCPVRGVSLGKTYKNKTEIRSLLKLYSKEDIEKVFRLEIKNKLGRYRMRNFSTFLNQFPDPSAICENTNEGFGDLFEQAEKNKREELLLKRFYDTLGNEEAVIYGIDPNVWYTMDEKAKNYHRAQPQKKEKLLKWIREHDNG